MKKRYAIGFVVLALAVWSVPMSRAEEAGSTAPGQVSTAQPSKKPARRLLMSGAKPPRKSAVTPPARPAVGSTESGISTQKKDKGGIFGWTAGEKSR